MITNDNFKEVLEKLGFKKNKDVLIKKFTNFDCVLKADFKNKKLIYPENKGLIVNERQSCNFKQNENYVVFECVNRLLDQGYNPKHLELEPKWQVGHGASGGRADILVKDNNDKSLLIIECKTAGNEFKKAWNNTQNKPTQLFSYVQQTKSTKFIALYTSDYIDENVEESYYLINLTDNKKLLEDNKELKSYKEATTVEELYHVWKDTYDSDYATLGLFENNEAYKIGKTKFNTSDLKVINSKDIQGKYHEFATILRQHNVSGRENAFDKLVNLFLCKVVDEKQNPNELKFYWKGKAYDSPFDLQDRIQLLYKEGMNQFLGEDITYIDNKAIDNAFRVFKDKPNSTKDIIKGYFKELKFFTNNDFAFIDVHNEKLFYQNFEVLLKIVRIFQDLKLVGSDENQFLGDMFEGFLDQGVKQSEGQFFTPMPIVKFINNSLPKMENPKVIDFACGAGHFLNDYSTISINSRIVGIEKEYRLSKVAKVSSFMYNQDIDIIYNDALKENENIHNSYFDILVANPPYSVKGFLETLSEKDRNKFDLINTIDKKSFTANNSIECFFIERMKHLLKSGGVAGIIVPSSILNKGSQNITTNKGNIYVATRELILKYFHIVAIAEFGSGTFGKTGTKTVTLFLKRREEKPNLANHFEDMVNLWFDGEFKINEKNFTDGDLLVRYCSYNEIDFELYKKLLENKLEQRLFDIEVFKEYQEQFDKLTQTKNRKKKKSYKSLSKTEKNIIELKELTKYIKLIEKDKLYYWSLASKNDCEVIIVKSPKGNAESKKFLGYDWSTAKGNEGIKYLTKQKIYLIDEDLEEDDKRVLENLQNLNNIDTPLYNPKDLEDNKKINKIIADNFNKKQIIIPDTLKQFVSKSSLVNMLDFSRKEFDKAISLSPNYSVEIDTKWDLVSLGSILNINLNSYDPSLKPGESFIYVDIESVGKGTGEINFNNVILGEEAPSRARRIAKKGEFIISSVRPNLKAFAYLDKDVSNCVFSTGFFVLNTKNNSELLNKTAFILFMYYTPLITQIEIKMGKGQYPSINKTDLENLKIPLPSLKVQKQIVKECESIDKKVANAQKIISGTKVEIETIINSIKSNSEKLSKLVKIVGGGTPNTSNPNYWNGKINWLSVGDFNNENRFVSTSEKTITEEGLKNSSTKILDKGNLIISARGTVGALAELSKPMAFNQSCYGLQPLLNLNSGYLYYILKREIQQLQDKAYGSKFDSITTKTFDNIKIPVPSESTQIEIVRKIEKLQTKINKAKLVVDSSKDKKQKILDNYMK